MGTKKLILEILAQIKIKIDSKALNVPTAI